MRMLVLAAAFGLFAGAVLADSDPPPPAWSGVWEGTLGDQKIEACFGVAGDPDGGSYYYLRHLKLIPLEAPTAPKGTWVEGYDDEKKDAPRWTLAAAGANVLSGTWSGSGKSLPIRLTRIALSSPDDADMPCGSAVFTAPRITATTLTSKPGVLDGVAFTTLTLNVGAHLDASIASFALDATTPGATRINAALAEPLSKKGDSGAAEYAECVADAAGTHADGEYHVTLKPNLISKHWMVSEEDDEDFCGGAHPNADEAWKLWDLTSGAAVDPWRWFNADGVTYSNDTTPPFAQAGPKLQKMLAARWTHKGECKDVLDGNDSIWDVHPTRRGLAFWPQFPHVVYACSQDVVIPYAELAPLLNAKGKAAVASIIEDLKTLPPPPAKKRKS